MDDHRTTEGLEHLQAAATELVAAARSFLDVAEGVIADPERFGGIAVGAADLIKSLTGRSEQPWERHAWQGSADVSSDETTPSADPDPDTKPAEDRSEATSERAEAMPVEAEKAPAEAEKAPAEAAPVKKPRPRARSAASKKPAASRVKRIAVD